MSYENLSNEELIAKLKVKDEAIDILKQGLQDTVQAYEAQIHQLHMTLAPFLAEQAAENIAKARAYDIDQNHKKS